MYLYLLFEKVEALDTFKAYKVEVERQTDRKENKNREVRSRWRVLWKVHGIEAITLSICYVP